jgi:uncharacterized glyoxalase superfamily protein PhnB
VITFNQLNLVAADFDATLEFYRRLGLAMSERPSHAGMRHAEVAMPNGMTLELDNVPLARIYNAAWRASAGGARALIGFSLPTREAVDRLYAELVGAGYQGRQKPYDAFWGARYAIVADPAGNDVGLMSPADESRKSWPPGAAPA